MKAILLIGDGLGDRPLKELRGKTPLEMARTPNIDKLAELGACGMMDPIAPGIRAGSDTSHLAILGYDPFKYYTGRGPFEALGCGMDLKPGDISFRCNFSTVDENFTVIDRRAGRIEEKDGTAELAKALDGMDIYGAKILVKESTAHRAALVIRGKNLGCRITDADPHKEGLKIHEVTGEDDESKKTAAVVNAFVKKSYGILKNHTVNERRKKEGKPQANILLPRGAGLAPHLEPFTSRYGMKACCIVETGLIRGIGRYVGMDTLDVPGTTGGLDTDTVSFAKKVLETLPNYDFILWNIKGTDVAGHDGNAKAKVAMIEKIDDAVGVILDAIPQDTYFVFTADHSTPCSLKDHSGDPVPVVIWGDGIRVDNVKAFNERNCGEGNLGHIRGLDLMNIVTNVMGVQEKFGA